MPANSEKSQDLDRKENLTKGNVSAKRVVISTYDSGGDTISAISAGNPLPVTGTIIAEASTLAEFQFNDSDATTTALTEYFGYTKPNGTWLVKKLTDTTLRYATITNNDAVTTYADAWAAIASLTYGRMDEAF